jgi:hypothetical protein
MSNDPPTPGDIAWAAQAARAASAERDRLIRAAHSAGASAREIAPHAGLSHQRIHQIIHNR